MMLLHHRCVKWVLFGSLDMCMGLFGTQGKTGMMDTTHRRDMGCMKGRVRLVGRLLAAASRTSLDTGCNTVCEIFHLTIHTSAGHICTSNGYLDKKFNSL